MQVVTRLSQCAKPRQRSGKLQRKRPAAAECGYRINGLMRHAVDGLEFWDLDGLEPILEVPAPSP
eukprot:2368165-Rhodomonas_salina.1